MADAIYVSTDVEADGPIPGPHSMLSFASVAFRTDKTIVGEFSVNLAPLPGAAPHPRTTTWWGAFPEALAKARENQEPPETAMPRYAQWLQGLPGRVVFVGQPAGFDFMWVYWYLIRYHGRSPFGHSALDVKTYAMALLKRDYRDCVKSALPPQWSDGLPHTHVALDDAREQGAMFCNMLRANGVEGA
ncbi:MAG TPA: exonuclease domain-containing protein [Planctomycetota bacterium]|nr:exonuclease domain-containing protein [Planctomycetota bacterium]